MDTKLIVRETLRILPVWLRRQIKSGRIIYPDAMGWQYAARRESTLASDVYRAAVAIGGCLEGGEIPEELADEVKLPLPPDVLVPALQHATWLIRAAWPRGEEKLRSELPRLATVVEACERMYCEAAVPLAANFRQVLDAFWAALPLGEGAACTC